MSVDDLLGRRLLFVTGKGGVGKSTCALALAVLAVRRGKRVLLCETGEQSAVRDLLPSTAPVGHEPSQPLPDRYRGLWVARFSPQIALQDYLVEHLGSERLVKLATQTRVLARLWSAAPSVNEMALLNAIFRCERARGADGQHLHDLVIVDLPATGHALAMLGVPDGVIALVRIGALAQRAKEIRDLVHDRVRTAVCVVTLPEELPVNESVDLITRLQLNLGIDVSHVLINCVLPDPFEPDERKLFDRLTYLIEAGPGRQLVEAVAWRESLREKQLRRIADLRSRVRATFVEIAYQPGDGLGRVEYVAGAVAGGGGSGARAP